MQVVENFKDNYNDDPIRYWNFKEFEDRANDCVLFVGAWPEPTLIKQNFDVPKYFFSTEEQAKHDDGTDQFVPLVDQIFTICPKEITKREKRVNAFFPLNLKTIPNNFNKEFDVIYTGLASHGHVREMINVLPKYRYKLVSFGDFSGLTTDQNVSYSDKLKLIAKSRICLTHNLIATNTPQLKSRCFEAAFCKSLMLVLRDQYNIVSQWFEPNIDFLYFDTNNITDIIDGVLKNYSDYLPLIENAHKKAINCYTTEKFIEKYIGWKK